MEASSNEAPESSTQIKSTRRNHWSIVVAWILTVIGLLLVAGMLQQGLSDPAVHVLLHDGGLKALAGSIGVIMGLTLANPLMLGGLIGLFAYRRRSNFAGLEVLRVALAGWIVQIGGLLWNSY